LLYICTIYYLEEGADIGAVCAYVRFKVIALYLHYYLEEGADIGAVCAYVHFKGIALYLHYYLEEGTDIGAVCAYVHFKVIFESAVRISFELCLTTGNLSVSGR
jgi:stage V sporulation protein SpoVS